MRGGWLRFALAVGGEAGCLPRFPKERARLLGDGAQGLMRPVSGPGGKEKPHTSTISPQCAGLGTKIGVSG